MAYPFILIFSYLLGAVPFGLVITKVAGLGDIRQIGSGNIGATNVLRTGRKDLALATLLLDSGKGAIAVLVTGMLTGWSQPAMALAGAAAFVGHCYPVYLGFQGGKGVATFMGTILALHFPVGLAACGFWLLTALISRFSSLSALVTAGLVPLLFLLKGMIAFAIAAVVMAGLIFYRHQPNIIRLLDGTEPKIGQK